MPAPGYEPPPLPADQQKEQDELWEKIRDKFPPMPPRHKPWDKPQPRP